MPVLLVLLELFVGTLAVWVPILSVALYWRISIEALEVVFLLVWILYIAVMARPWLRRLRGIGRPELVFARDTLVLGCLVGLLVLVVSRPDADDVGYIYQPLIDSSSPGSPFTVEPFLMPFRGKPVEIPFLSENEAYEAMVVVVAGLVGIDPLQVYHNVFAFLAAIMWVVTYALLFRRFRVSRSNALVAVLAVVTFLLLDGNLHRSFGNFSLLRIWQGKIVVWSILGPAFLLFALRFLARPSGYRYVLFLATAVVSYFINRSSVLLFAVMGTAIAASYFFVSRKDHRRAVRTLALVAVIVPLWGVGAAAVLSSLPFEGSIVSLVHDLVFDRDSSVGRVSIYGASWWDSLYKLVIGSQEILVRDSLFLLVLPLVVLPRPLGRIVLLLSLVIVALAFTPLTGPVLYYFLEAVYWRLYYSLPLPFCAGLIVLLILPSQLSRQSQLMRFGLAIVLVFTTFVAVERPALSPANQVELKPPFEFRFPQTPLMFARSVTPHLHGKLVLAPNEVAGVLALTEYDSIDLVYARTSYQGNARARANRVITFCRVNKLMAKSLGDMLGLGVDVMITASCDETFMRRLGRLVPDYRLEEATELSGSGYRLFWVRRATQP